MENLGARKQLTIDAKIIKYSAAIALGIFFVILFAGIIFLFAQSILPHAISRVFFALTGFLIFVPILMPIIFLPLLFSFVAFIFPEMIANRKATKIIFLLANIFNIIFYSNLIIGNALE